MNCRRRSRIWVAFAVALCVLACEQAEPGWVAQVETAHAEADAARTPLEHGTAQRALERAYSQVPGSSDPREIWILQDLCTRIGEAALAGGRSEEGLRWADQGLGLSKASNIARADLLGLRGKALEALGRKEEAASSLHEALTINQALMERALQGKTTNEDQR